MAEHTPLPWKLITEDISLIESEAKAPDGYNYIVAHCLDSATSQVDFDTRDANAAFIVKAVNSHDVLVKALQPFLALADAVFEKYEVRPGEFREANSHKSDSQVWSYNFTPITYDDLRRVRAALASAQCVEGE